MYKCHEEYLGNIYHFSLSNFFCRSCTKERNYLYFSAINHTHKQKAIIKIFKYSITNIKAINIFFRSFLLNKKEWKGDKRRWWHFCIKKGNIKRWCWYMAMSLEIKGSLFRFSQNWWLKICKKNLFHFLWFYEYNCKYLPFASWLISNRCICYFD